jgi:hypothetical protein
MAAVVFLAALHVRLKIFCTLRMPLIEGCQPFIEGLNGCEDGDVCVCVERWTCHCFAWRGCLGVFVG